MRQNAWAEWSNAYYFISERRRQLPPNANFIYFLHTYQSGYFYPQHLFYGGFATLLLVCILYPLSSLNIFLVSIFLAYISAYIGCFLILRFFNAERLVAAGLSLSVALSPYMVTELYGRGAWAELMGFSCCLLSIGWFLKLIRLNHRKKLIENISFVLVTAVAISVHNLSSVLAFLFLLPILTVYWLMNGATKTTTTWRGVSYFALLGLGAVMTTMFFTLPNFYFGRDTDVSKWNISNTGSYLSGARILLSPVLMFPPEQQNIHRAAFGTDVEVRLFNQTLVIFLIVSSILVLYLLINQNRRMFQRLMIIGIILIPWVQVAVQIEARYIIQAFPWVSLVQFPYRLTPYLTLSIAISTSLVFQRFMSVKMKRFLNLYLLTAVLWYVALAIFQANTSVYSAPPGFAKPNLSDINRGVPSPLFAGNTAAPIQFRFTNIHQGSSQNLVTLNFDKDGFPRKLQSFDVRITWANLISQRSHILVQTGQHGRATSIGFIKSSVGRILVIDCWGQSPIKMTMKDLEATALLSFKFDWSLNKVLIASTSLRQDIVVDLISDELYTLRFGTNTAESSVLEATGEGKYNVSSIKQSISVPDPGRYRTNVVFSPLTKWAGTLGSESSNDGMWIVKISTLRPHVAMNWSLPVWLGLIFSVIGLLLVVVLLLYGVRRPA